MSITSFRLAREAQEAMIQQQAAVVEEAALTEEAYPMPAPVEAKKDELEKIPTSSGAATVKSKPKATTQK
jgi:hypothetical protein